MIEEQLIENDQARVLDVLFQIKELNKMIALHRNQPKNDFMRHQYEDLKERYLEELKAILHDYEIEVKIKGEAA